MSYELHQGDCLEILPTIESNSVDLVFTDCPYNVSNGKKDIDRRLWDSPKAKRTSVIRQDFGNWDKFPTVEAFGFFTMRWLNECHRILKPGGTLYSFFPFDDISHLKDWGKAVGLQWLNAIAWHKLNPAPNFNNMSRYCHAIEAIGWFSKGPVATFNGNASMHNFLESGLCQGDERTAHPTQKPVSILEQIIEVSSNPGDLILDPFLGSGSTLVAAKKLGRRGIGIEGIEDYYRMAGVRLRLWEPSDADLLLLNGIKPSDDIPAMPLFDLPAAQ